MTILCFRVLVLAILLPGRGAWAEVARRGTRAMFAC